MLRTFGAVAVVLFLGCTRGHDSEPLYTVVDSAGIPIVEYDALPSGPEFRFQLSASPIISVGVEDGPEPYTFRSIRGARRLEDGSMLVHESFEFRVFDPQGRFVRQFGRRGQGPGEFTGITLWVLSPRDSVTVWDGGQRRFTVFSIEGKLGRVVPASQLIPDFTSADAISSTFDLYMHRTEFGEVARLRNPTTYVHWSISRPDVLDTLTEVESWSGAFRPMQDFVLLGDGFVFMTGDVLGFQVFDSDGKPRRAVRVSETPVRISDEDIAAFAEMRAAGTRDPGRRPAILREVLESPHAEYHAFVDQLRMDSQNRVWLRRNSLEDEAVATWVVFETDGAYVGSLDMPANFNPTDIESDVIVGVWRGEFDVPILRVYGLTEPPEAK